MRSKWSSFTMEGSHQWGPVGISPSIWVVQHMEKGGNIEVIKPAGSARVNWQELQKDLTVQSVTE